MTSFPLRMTDEPKALATQQAERAGVSPNQYITTIPALRVGAQAEAEAFFAARAKRARPGALREVLARMGTEEPRDGDRIDDA
jgi:hypothetical protein